MLLLKALARVVEVALMAAVALIAIGIGLYCFSGLISLGSARPDRLLHLTALRHHVGDFLARTAAPGPTALLALLGGIAAVLAGLLLLLGLLGSRRERMLVLEDDGGEGGVYARPRAVSRMLRIEAERTPGVTGARRPKVQPGRHGTGGKVKLRASRGPDPDAETVDRAVHERLDPLTEPLGLRSDIRVRLVTPKAEKA